jgi:hypothetical protein
VFLANNDTNTMTTDNTTTAPQPPYTPDQVLANLAECERQLCAYAWSHSGPGWVRDVLRSITERGIANDATKAATPAHAPVKLPSLT